MLLIWRQPTRQQLIRESHEECTTIYAAPIADGGRGNPADGLEWTLS
jgi:hypothetical protein